MTFAGFVAVVVVTGAVVLVVRGWDVRLVLLAAALAIGTAAGDPARVVREFLATFSNEKFVVPICAAMGFAYVLRHTGCERHLVLLLVRPLRYVRRLLVPGVIGVGFLVNIPVISQTSTAVCIGPVVVPLMRAAGYSMPTIGACLLLGTSVGGELMNPGAPELLTVFAANPGEPRATPQALATEALPPLVFTQLFVSTLVFWAMSVWWERRADQANPDRQGGGEGTQPAAPSPTPLPPKADADQKDDTGTQPAPSPTPSLTVGVRPEPDRVNLLKALVPLVPLSLLFASGLPKPYQLFDVPDAWVIATKADGTRDPAYNTRLIGLAMLVGVLVAAAATPAKARDCVKQFFDGAGYGFTHVVSLIVVANCFGASISAAGLAESLKQLIDAAPNLLQPLAGFVPLGFAAVSGSGMASTQSLYGFFHVPAVALGIDPVDVGALVSLGAAAGRTMSPVAAVTLMCAALTGTNPFTLAKRVAVPLLVGMVVVVALRMSGVL